jgi:hypothetical protein
MKLISKYEFKFDIAIDENYSISYKALELFFDTNTFEGFFISNRYMMLHEVNDEVCNEMFRYFLSNDMIIKQNKLYYEILDEKFAPMMRELELFFLDVKDNYEAYKREHIIDSVLDI